MLYPLSYEGGNRLDMLARAVDAASPDRRSASVVPAPSVVPLASVVPAFL